MEPSKIRRVDAFEKSYTPNGQNTRVAAPNSPGTMSQRYQRFRSSLHEYGNSASFHGLRFVTDPLANKPRRLVSNHGFINKNWQGWTLHDPILTSLSISRHLQQPKENYRLHKIPLIKITSDSNSHKRGLGPPPPC